MRRKRVNHTVWKGRYLSESTVSMKYNRPNPNIPICRMKNLCMSSNSSPTKFVSIKNCGQRKHWTKKKEKNPAVTLVSVDTAMMSSLNCSVKNAKVCQL